MPRRPGAREKLGVDEVMQLTSLPTVLGGFVAEDLRPRSKEIWTQQDMNVATSAIGFTGNRVGHRCAACRRTMCAAGYRAAHGQEPG